MNQMQTFSLAELKQLLDGFDEKMANHFITQNLAVARHMKVSLLKDVLTSGPIVMPEMRIIILKEGRTDPVVNMVQRHCVAGDLMFVAGRSIVQFDTLPEKVMGLGLSMSDELFGLAVGNHIPKAFDGHLRDFCVHLDDEQLQLIDELHRLIYVTTSMPEPSLPTTLHLIGALLWHVNHLWQRQEAESRSVASREQQLLANFLQLVSKHAHEQHTIDYYANCLCLSPRYMGTIVKRVSGQTAKHWIDEALVTRCKAELLHTSKQVAQVSDEMNFPNPSFFSKFFKRMTGITPAQYRRATSVVQPQL